MKKIIVALLTVTMFASLVTGCGSSTTNTSKEETQKETVATTEAESETTEAETEAPTEETSEYADYLKKDIGILFYSSVRNDTTGNWRNAICSTATTIDEYAYAYYKTYFTADNELHFISNLGLKTTSKLQVSGTALQVTTYEYVDKEEHDAKILGSGMKLDEFAIDLETGEIIDAAPDASAGTVSSEELISAVTEAIDGQVGAGEEITGVEFADGMLTITVDLSGREQNSNIQISDEMLAPTRASSISEAVLELEDQYLNSFDAITVDFGSVGHITCKMADVVDEGYGKYFNITDDMLVH